MHKLRLVLLLSSVWLVLNTFVHAEQLPTASPEEVGMSTHRLSAIDDVMRRRVQTGQLVGVSVLVSRNEKVFYFKQFGLMDIEANKPMRPDTIVRIYSMTKAVTSVAALILCEDGKLSLDDPVEKFLPEFAARSVYLRTGNRPAKSNMTIRHLMLHTSGFIYGKSGGSALEQEYQDADLLNKDGTLQDIIDRLAQLPLAFDPGSAWEYGLSADVLGAVIERASGQTLANYFNDRIFIPLGMVDTGFEVPTGKLDRFAVLYEPRKDKWHPLDKPLSSRFSRPATAYSGGGGLVSTAPDYWRFLRMVACHGEVDGKRLLSAGAIDLMTHNQLNDTIHGISHGFGLGFRVLIDPIPSKEKRLLGEYGWFGRACTHYWTNPHEKLTTIILEQRIPSADRLFDMNYAVIHPLVYEAIESASD